MKKSDIKNEYTNLLDALMLLKSKNEVQNFLRDLLTEQELSEFENRWNAAQMLSRKIPYFQIQQETGLSSATVARVSMWLRKGKGGYQIAINKLLSKHHKSTIRKKGLG
jgi:TrpR-related protein YerC/YecD